MIAALRIVAILIACAALVDPAFAVRRAVTPVIDVRIGADHLANPEALDLRDRVVQEHGRRETSKSAGGAPSAVVLVAPSTEDLNELPAGVPVSFVDLAPLSAGDVRIRHVHAPGAVLPGQQALVTADIDASGLAGRTTIVALEQQGMELARATLSWTREREMQTAALTYAPPAAGMQPLRVIARGAGGAERDAVDVPVIARARELRVMSYEPRPSWSVAFVRRALEADPVFDAAALARASRGVEVRAGRPPDRLTAAGLESFDAVIVGAPEALTATEVDVLETFIRIRGGAVILLPDRRPSGAYTRLMPVERFDEMLVETPLALDGAVGLKGSEFALPLEPGAGATVVASIRLKDRGRPVIVSWPLGAGRLVFSGALDAWRYRAEGDDAFAKFWTGIAASLAASAPRSLEVTVHPALAAPGDRVSVRASLRQTEWAPQGNRIELPPTAATLVAADGRAEPIRLWPSAEPGRFEGHVVVREPGRFDVRASAGTLTADAPLVVNQGLRKVHAVAGDAARIVARATGGVAVTSLDLDALHDHLRGLRSPEEQGSVRPMRSGWWMFAFAGALCGEWTLRRRRGLR